MKPLTLLSLVALLLAGCSAPQFQRERTVRLYSEPPGVRVILMSADGTAVWTGETPTDMPLSLKVANYKVLFQKDGYRPSGFSLNGSIGGWFYGDFATGSPAVNAYIDPVFDGNWAPLQSKLTWHMVPSTVQLGTTDMQALERSANTY